MSMFKKFAPFMFVVLMLHLIGLGKTIKWNSNTLKNKSDKKVTAIKLKFQPRKTADQTQAKQVATTVQVDNNEVPKEKSYLSEKNQTVSRQTQSRVVDRFNEGGAGAPTPPSVASKPQEKPKKKFENLKLSDMAKLAAMNTQPPTPTAKPSPASKPSPLQGSQGRGRGIASNNDYLEEIPLGDMSKLNTVEFKHYGFYQRIKGKLEQHWGSTLRDKAEKIYAQGRKLASINYITSLMIIMDQQGNIVDVKVKSASGVTELDEAAIESFNKAGPFPNPPKDMLNGGLATIEWGFVVKS